MSPVIRRAKSSSSRVRWTAAAFGVAALAAALWPLTATADHAQPQLPLTAPIVQALSACNGPAGTSIPTGTVGNATTPPDRNNTSSSNEHTPGTQADLVIHANAESDPKELTLDISGSHNIFDGLIDSRSHLKIGGSWNLLRHGTEYGQRSVSGKVAFDLTGSNNCFSPIPIQEYENAPPESPAGFPLTGDFDPDQDGNVLEHFAPGTVPALAAMADPTPGPQYFVCGIPDPDGSATGAATAPGCSGSGGSAIMDRNLQGQVLERGLYFVTGRIKLSASNLNATITMVSGQQLNVNGSFQGQGVNVFNPYTDASGKIIGGLLFASQWDEAAPLTGAPDGKTFPDGGTANDSPNTDRAEDALKIEGSLSRFEGVIVATNGRTEVAGEQLDFRCPVMGDRVRVNGSKNYFNASGCIANPRLSISKSPDLASQVDGTINVGQPAKFTITVTNHGSGPAANVDIDDTLPGTGLTWLVTSAKNDGADLVGPDGCTITSGNVLHCDVASLAAGKSIVVVVTSSNTTPANQCAPAPGGDGGVLDNGTAEAGAAGDALADSDNNPQVNDPGKIIVTCPALTISKKPDLANETNGTINAGQPAVFTITVANTGTGAATDVDIDDVLPGTGLTWSVTSAQKNGVNLAAPDSCAISGTNVLHCDVASLPASQSIVVVVTSSNTSNTNQCAPSGDGGVLDNGTAAAGAAGDALAVASNAAQVNDPGKIIVTCPALIIEKSPDLASETSGTINAGQAAVFTIRVTNTGNGAATNVDIDDVLPGTGLTWSVTSAQKNGVNLAAPDGCGITGTNVLHCDVASLPANQSIVVVVTSSATTNTNQCAPAPLGDGGVLDNGTDAVGAAGDALAVASNAAQVNDPGKITVTCPALDIEKEPDLANETNGTINAGQAAVFTITVTNTGTGAATNVDIDDVLPGTGLTWLVTSAQKAGANLVAPDACAITSGNVLHCDVASLPANQSIVVVVTSSATTHTNQCAPAPFGDGGVLDNGTAATGAAGDALAVASNAAQVNDPGKITVTCPELDVDKEPDLASETNGTINAGQAAVFTITVKNTGNGAATNVDIDDVLPGTGLTWLVTSAQNDGVDLVAPDGCGITSGNVLHCDVASLAVGKSIVVVVTSSATTTENQCAAAPNGDGGVLDNGTAAAGAAGDALAIASNAAQANDPGKITVTCPGLTIQKKPDLANETNGTINAGQAAVFTITVTNTGSGAATDVEIDDVLPGTGLTWSVTSAKMNGADLVAPDGCEITGDNVLHCDVASLPANQSIVVVVTSSNTTNANQCSPAPDGDGGVLDNGTAEAGAAGDALAIASNAAQVNDPGKITVTCPELDVEKEPDLSNETNGTINAGQAAVFTITVTNNGTGAATDVEIDDILPGTGLTWSVTSAQNDGEDLALPDTCAITGDNVLHCDVASLAAGKSIVVVVTSSATTAANQCAPAPNGDGGVLDNGTAEAGAAGDALAIASNAAEASDPGKIAVTCGAILIEKRSTKKNAAGQNVLVSNPGALFSVDAPGTAPDFTVKDNNTPVPAGTKDDENTLVVGIVCVSGLEPGNYTVNETGAPAGYGGASQSNVVAVAAAGTNCTDNLPTLGNRAVFTNPPLFDIQVNFRDGGSGETSLTSIDCDNNGAGADPLDLIPAFPWQDTVTHLGIAVEPGPIEEVVCTIVVDP